MRKTTILLVLGASVFLAQCAKKTSVPAATTTASKPATSTEKTASIPGLPGAMADAEKVATIKHSFTEEQIGEGKNLFMNNCGKCHKLFEPQNFNVARWEQVLPPMSIKAHLSSEDAAKVRAWVLSNARLG